MDIITLIVHPILSILIGSGCQNKRSDPTIGIVLGGALLPGSMSTKPNEN